MRRRPVYIAVLAIAAIALMLAVLTLYAGSRKAPAARSAASAPADVEQTLSPLAAGKNCAVFAAYSADGTVSDYVIDYLRALKEIAPNIVYVTDNPIPESEIAKLRPYVNHLIARRHGEYDWGSYKRGFAWLKRQNALPSRPAAASGIPSRAAIVPAPASDITAAASGIPPRAAIVPAPASDTAAAASFSSSAPVPHTASAPQPPSSVQAGSTAPQATAPLLILANDSSLLVAPSLRPVLQASQTAGADIFGITANADGIYHLQSYFLIIAPQVYNTSEFAAYLNAVRPEKDGLTVAARYEVPFTAYFAGLGFTSAAYIPYEKLSWLPLNDKNCYPLTLLGKYHAPFLKMRTFTSRLNVQEPRRLVFAWLKKHVPGAYARLLQHLQKINSPYLKEDR